MIEKICSQYDFKFDEMEYTNDRIIKILAEGTYYNYHFFVVSYGTHPCCYVEIPRQHQFYGKDYNYDGIEDLITCHGGLTFSAGYLPFLGNLEGKWFIGWDFAHWQDYCPYIEGNDGKKWTTKELIEEVGNVCEQLREYEI